LSMRIRCYDRNTLPCFTVASRITETPKYQTDCGPSMFFRTVAEQPNYEI
jgi:hypothetical protein